MRCDHCRSIMDQTDQVVERHTRQTWYRCPVCHSLHTVSEPLGDLRYPRSAQASGITETPQHPAGVSLHCT
jgi:hypothetical protein